MLKEDPRFPFERELVRVHCDCFDNGDGNGPRRVGPYGFHPLSDADQREVIQDGPRPTVLYRVAEDTRNLDLFRSKEQLSWVVVEGSRNTNQWAGRILDADEAAAVRKSKGRTAGKPIQQAIPLTEREQQIADLIWEKGPLSGKEICNQMGIDQSSLTSQVIPVLKKPENGGLKNRRGVGYFFPSAMTRQ